MKAESRDDLHATRSASPSMAKPTSTSEPQPATIPAHQRPSAGRQLRDPDRYQIICEHGRGGLGRVSRAHDRDLGRDVAIKELISRGNVSEVRFLREALITARLEHPGIVPVHEAGQWPDGTPFYAMKLVAGRPLRDLLSERTTVAERIALLHHVIAVADALAYAHGRNIIHRDLKPANVIVGDFGETIVIDWGLAKDLSTTEEFPSGGPFRSDRDNDLTAAGSVLGTPSYMAPEQERGDYVDQRADVFAIGAMLWELCALQKVPPTDPHLRHRLLRRSGIDQDLITIIDKALAPEPGRRYPDAAALASDLKAFKSGARIAARSYSLFAVLAHWTRRHRTLAGALVIAAAISTAVAVLYVRNIATERDRADTSETDAKRARESAEGSLDELTLKHAELLLQSDPTATVSLLANYHGRDIMRHMQLLAEAHGRGVARSVLHPHNDTIYFLAGQPDGSIVSLGEDHRVRRTINEITTTLSSDVSYIVHFAYSPTCRLLAYATSRHGFAIINLHTNDLQRIDTTAPISLSFSPDGSQLAALDKSGTLVVWNATAPSTSTYRRTFPDATKIAFVGAARIAILGRATLQIIGLDDSRASALAVSPAAIHSNNSKVAIGTGEGDLLLLSTELTVFAKLRACKERVTAVQFVPGSDSLAFGCQEGGVGIARYKLDSQSLIKIDGFQTQSRVSLLAIDDTGQLVMASCERDTYLHHMTSGLTTRLRGQAARISAVAAATRDFNHLLTADVNGTMRIWDFAEPHARVLAHVQGLTLGARFSPDGTALAVFGLDPIIRIIRLTDGSTTRLQGHTDAIGGVRYSPDGQLLMSFSWDGTARIWQPRDGTPLRVFEGHGSLVQSGDFIEGGRRAVTVGDDGHLFAWKSSASDLGASEVVSIFAREDPLISLQILGKTNNIVVQDSAGALWLVGPEVQTRQIRQADDAEVTILRASSDGRFLAIGQDSGTVTVYRTIDWTVANRFVLAGTVARIEFDPHDRDLLILSEDGFVYIKALDAHRPVPWAALQARAHDITYTPDGELIAITTLDGGCWFYSMRNTSWFYVQDHTTEVWSGRFSPDGSVFVSIDRDGAVVARDVSALFSPASIPAPH